MKRHPPALARRYARALYEVARAQGKDPARLPLQYGHFGGEPWTEEMRVEIERFDRHLEKLRRA